MNTDLVSIIIPIYNVATYMDKCVESACAQTYRNLEIILVDDGSPDECPAKCDIWAEKDSRITVIHKKNGGLSDARNAGLDIAKGKYIYFLDGDDYIEHNLIEIVLQKMAEDVDLVSFGHLKEYSDCTKCMIKAPGEFIIHSDSDKIDFFLHTLLPCRIGWEAWSRIFRRDIIERYQLRFADNRKIFAEDLYFSLCYCSHIQKIVNLPLGLYHYTIRNDSIMGTDIRKNNVNRMNELSKAVKHHFDSHNDCGSLLTVFPVIHYLIVDNSFEQLVKNEVSWKDLRGEVLSHVSDRAYFIKMLRQFPKFQKLTYRVMDCWRATYQIIMCKYLLTGFYGLLRIRSRLLNTTGYYYKKAAKITGLHAEYKRLSKCKNRVFLLGTEEFGNIGDNQINESTTRFLKQVLPEYTIHEVPFTEWSKNKPLLKQHIRPNELIVFAGGGNFGDAYPNAQNLRSAIIRLWPHNPKIVFPQTIDFSEDGKEMLAEAQELYTKENNIILCAREQKSFDFAKKHFSCDSILVPDIVLSENIQQEADRENVILLCMRRDIEKALSDVDVHIIEKICSAMDAQIKYTDLQLDYTVKKKNRLQIISDKLNLWRSVKVLITDRLHGMVFAAITGTPCIVFSNYNHKVRGTYEWIKYLPYIRFAESVEDVEKYIPELLAMENCQYDNTPLMPYYDKLAEIIKQQVCK